MNQTILLDEIIDEIGTQTLARLGLNIFKLNTYGAYVESVKGTTNVFNSYENNKNNPNYYGKTFEDLDVTQRNVNARLHKIDKHYATTDSLGEINHPITDERVFDSNGNIIENYQLKVVKKSADLFGKNDKYLENDKIVVAKDDYERHKHYFEKMAENANDSEKKKDAMELLNKLEASEITREESKNPRITAIKIQTKQGLNNIVQTGISDAVIVALSTLASGTIYEIKDALRNNSEKIPIKKRIKRLLKKVLSEFYKAFKRGASFGALEVGIGILTQIFNSISSKIIFLWKNIRTSAKSIYNAIYSFLEGKIKTYKELFITIVKGILSAITIAGTVVLETKLEVFLSPIVTPHVASYLAPALAIVIGSIAVVLTMKTVDMALNAIFSIFAKVDLSKIKRKKIEEICSTLLPELIEEKQKLKKLIEKTYKERKLTFEKSFNDFKKGITNNNIETIIRGLSAINAMYGKKLQFQSFKEFNNFLYNNDEPLKL